VLRCVCGVAVGWFGTLGKPGVEATVWVVLEANPDNCQDNGRKPSCTLVERWLPGTGIADRALKLHNS